MKNPVVLQMANMHPLNYVHSLQHMTLWFGNNTPSPAKDSGVEDIGPHKDSVPSWRESEETDSIITVLTSLIDHISERFVKVDTILERGGNEKAESSGRK